MSGDYNFHILFIVFNVETNLSSLSRKKICENHKNQCHQCSIFFVCSEAALWFIHSVYSIKTENKALKIRDLIAFADYTNHAIMTFEEFSGAMAKFIAIVLITINNNELKVLNKFMEWFKNQFDGKKRMNFMKEINDIKTYLNKNYIHIEFDLKITDIAFSKEYFDKTVADYLIQ